jgi:hypothetical protein
MFVEGFLIEKHGKLTTYCTATLRETNRRFRSANPLLIPKRTAIKELIL